MKNTDIVHNAPWVEERSTFYNPPIFHFLYKTSPFSTFLNPHSISCLRACARAQFTRASDLC